MKRVIFIILEIYVLVYFSGCETQRPIEENTTNPIIQATNSDVTVPVSSVNDQPLDEQNHLTNENTGITANPTAPCNVLPSESISSETTDELQSESDKSPFMEIVSYNNESNYKQTRLLGRAAVEA